MCMFSRSLTVFIKSSSRLFLFNRFPFKPFNIFYCILWFFLVYAIKILLRNILVFYLLDTLGNSHFYSKLFKTAGWRLFSWFQFVYRVFHFLCKKSLNFMESLSIYYYRMKPYPNKSKSFVFILCFTMWMASIRFSFKIPHPDEEV